MVEFLLRSRRFRDAILLSSFCGSVSVFQLLKLPPKLINTRSNWKIIDVEKSFITLRLIPQSPFSPAPPAQPLKASTFSEFPGFATNTFKNSQIRTKTNIFTYKCKVFHNKCYLRFERKLCALNRWQSPERSQLLAH